MPERATPTALACYQQVGAATARGSTGAAASRRTDQRDADVAANERVSEVCDPLLHAQAREAAFVRKPKPPRSAGNRHTGGLEPLLQPARHRHSPSCDQCSSAAVPVSVFVLEVSVARPTVVGASPLRMGPRHPRSRTRRYSYLRYSYDCTSTCIGY